VCGLAGIVRFDGAPVSREALERMGEALRHRGPDAQGLHVDGAAAPGVGLVHRRLSIIDLSERADQPIANEDGSVRVMLNGEIYNFPSLRPPLEGRHAFRSQGDTEVIAHLYEELAEDAIARLDGMFSIALWDAQRRRLLLARDPFGKKPLYYFGDARRFVFGSEIKALLAAGVPAEFDADNLGEYLAYGYVPTPRTLFRGIRKLPPASLMTIDASGIQGPRAYWQLRVPAAGDEARVAAAEARERVSELLTAAVRKRLLSDVPLGALLSGGVDSSVITAIMARLVPGRVKTFTVGFEGHSFYDERAHAERVARHLGTEHHASVVKPEAASLVQTLLHHHDEPFGDSSALPTYLVSREARRHVTVVVNGDGGDETFAGYDRFQAALLAERLPSPLRRALRAASRVLPEGASYHGTLQRIHRFAEQAVLPVDERIFAWTGFFDLPALARLDGGGVVDRSRVLSSYAETLAACNGASLLSRLLYLNLRTYLLDDLLPKADRMTMAHGLEGRSPLLDRELVEYATTLPDALKRRGGRGKIVLKEVGESLLPPGILERRKHGFGVPLGDWFRGELRPMVEDTLLAGPRLGRRLRADGVRQIFDEHVSGRADRGHQLWTLLTLELWLRKHGFD
jgi:asparagine synthase (glutamine-hydrolysing)